MPNSREKYLNLHSSIVEYHSLPSRIQLQLVICIVFHVGSRTSHNPRMSRFCAADIMIMTAARIQPCEEGG